MSDQTITIEAEPVDATARRVAETAMSLTVSDSVDATARRVAETAMSLTVSDSVDATARRVVSVPAQQLDSVVVTVKTAARTAYTYCARAVRRLHWFITVRASAFAVVLESRVRAFIKNVFPKTGADILRQSAILNI